MGKNDAQESERIMPLTLPRIALETLSDIELAAHAGRGEEQAFEVVMRRHNRLLFRTARSILRDDADAEDCVQEAYLQAFRHMASFRGQAKLGTWLTRIVINQALERIRGRKKEDGNVALDNVVDLDAHALVTEAGMTTPEEPDASAARAEVRGLLERHIDRLPAAFRTVFVLRALEELSVEETASCLGIPEATVRTRFFRARALLRTALDHDVDLALAEAFGFAGARCDRIVAGVLNQLKDLRTPVP